MPYPFHEMAIIAAVMTFGSMMQGALGFASGLIGVPLLVLAGFNLLDATVINFISTAVQNVVGAVRLYDRLKWSDVSAPIMWRFLGLPLGIYALNAMQGVDQNRVKQLIGIFLLASVGLLVGLRVKPRERIGRGWTATAFLSAGFLMGFASIGGAPMVLYVNCLTWPADKSRGFLFVCSAALMPLMAIMLVWQFGAAMTPAAIAALMVMPLGVAGLWAGLWAGGRLDKWLFRRITYLLLVVVAVCAIFSPILFKSR